MALFNQLCSPASRASIGTVWQKHGTVWELAVVLLTVQTLLRWHAFRCLCANLNQTWHDYLTYILVLV